MARSIQNSLYKSIVGVKVSVTHGCKLTSKQVNTPVDLVRE